MVSSLRYAVRKKFGEIDYIYYFRRMIKDYEAGRWDFDVRTVVRNIKVEIPCPKYVCRKGFLKRMCLTILNDEIFANEFNRYFNGYIRPMQELRKNRILARRIWFKKYGYFTKYNQDCLKANYNCKICASKTECLLMRKYNKNDGHIMRLTKIFEILYGNLNSGYWARLVGVGE